MTIFRNRNRFKPPSDERTWVRIVPGNYTLFDGSRAIFYEYVEHFAKRAERGHICSRIWKEDEEGNIDGSGKCVSCYERNDGANDISWRRLSAFLITHLDYYLRVPAEDKDGNILHYEQDSKFHKKGDVIYNKMLEEEAIGKFGRRTLQREGYDRVFGNLMHWSMGINHLLVLSSKLQDLEEHCRCGGRIEVLIWECGACGHEIFDLTPEGNCDLTKKELAATILEPYKCPSCGKVEMLKPVIECDSCRDPEPLQLWDVDLQVSRQGEGTSSILVINDWRRAGTGLTDEEEEAIKELIPEKDILHRVFAGDALDYQAKILRVKNPFGSDAKDTRRHTQEYDNQREDDPVDDDDIPF